MIMATTRRISERAAPRANPRNSRPPQRRLAGAETTAEERDRLAAAVVILLACRQERLALVGDLPEPCLDLLHDLGRQWRVEEIRRVLLAVVDHPPEELHQQLALRLVGLVFVDEEPREARDRVRVIAGGVRERDTEIGGHGPPRAGRRGRRRLDARLDERPRGLTNRRRGGGGLDGVGPLDGARGA